MDGHAGAAEADGIMRTVDLRAEPIPPRVSRRRLDELCREIARIAGLVHSGSGSADGEIRAFDAPVT